MLNIIKKISCLIVVCTVSIIISGGCYATRTVTPVIIKCSPTPREAQWQKHRGRPGVTLTLNSLGMRKVSEGEELIRIWDIRPGNPNVPATCTPTRGPGNYVHMFPALFRGDSDVLPTLTCAPGEGISVRLASPNCRTPEDEVYWHGELIEDDSAPPPRSIPTLDSGHISISTAILGGMGGGSSL